MIKTSMVLTKTLSASLVAGKVLSITYLTSLDVESVLEIALGDTILTKITSIDVARLSSMGQ
jgi:hypothetical protein